MACNKTLKAAQEQLVQVHQAAVDAILKTGGTVYAEGGLGAKKKGRPNEKSFGRPRRLGNGIIEYPRKGYEPPPMIDGFDRDPGNPWRFLPKWPKCKNRMQNMQLKSCGAVALLTICNHPDSEHRRSEVNFSICSNCPLVNKCESTSSEESGNSST